MRPGRCASLAAAAVLLGIGWHWWLFQGDVRALVSYQPGGAPVVLDRDGNRFADLAPVAGQLVRLATLPRHVPDAFIAVEDRRFREHGAVDWRRVAGALVANARAGRTVQGSSTLTMQLARTLYPEKDDQSLRGILVGVIARNGATAEAWWDDLQILVDGPTGDALVQKERQVAGERYSTGIRHHAEVKALASGMSVQTVGGDGPLRTWKNSAEGKLLASAAPGAGKPRGGQGKGTWHVADNGTYCVQIQWERRTENWCRFIFRVGADKYYGVKSDVDGAAGALEMKFF